MRSDRATPTPRPRPAVVGMVAVIVLSAAIAAGAATDGPSRERRHPSRRALADGTATAGIDHKYDGGFEYAVGGGVAVFDCTGDGRPDLYLAGGSGPAALYRNDSPIGGALRFTRLGDPATDLTGVTGAYPIDIDGDGVTDLVVLRNGETVLLRGLGGCRFTRANEAWGFDGGTSITTAFSATWEAGASRPTLAFGNYVDPASNDPHHLCFDNEIVRPALGAATYGRPSPLVPSWCALSMLFSDWNRSGRMDLRVSNDAHYYLPTDGQEQLWRVAPGEPPSLYTADDGWVPRQIRGMWHRELRRHRRRISSGLPHQPGGQSTADARRRAIPADLPRHRVEARRERRPAVHRRRRPAVDRVARRIR